MVYQWKTQGLYKISAADAGAEIERCRESGGVITPAAVVKRASDVDSVLHSCFEWNDGKAAVKWREQEARVLIANIVTVITPDEQNKPTVMVRAFVNVFCASDRGYKNIVSVLSNENDRTYMLNRALSELESFKIKYANLTELSPVFAVIEEVAKNG